MPVETFKINMIEEGVEKDLTRTDVVELLYNDVATVTFTKADGTERVMECTLLADVLNKRFETDTDFDLHKKIGEENMGRDVVVVYDIPTAEWRSFRMDSVKSISIPTT